MNISNLLSSIRAIDLILLISLYVVFYLAKSYMSIKVEQNRLAFLSESVDIDKANSIIDDLVTVCMEEYLAYNPQINNEVYINSQLEKEIVENVVKLSVSRISPVLLDKLSLVYNAEVIGDIIARRAYLKVIIYEMEFENLKQAELEKHNRETQRLPEY